LHTESPEYSLSSLCELFGVSRQAFYQRKELDFESEQFKICILEYVLEIRKDAPKMGCQKLLIKCKEYFGEAFYLGRDAFYDLLNENKLMVRIRRRHTRTTDSNHNFHRYPNLIKNFVPSGPNMLWVADITYIPLSVKFCYLSLVTDAYSHKIVGWVLAPSLAYHYTEKALQKAIDKAHSNLEGMIHHSDRGLQYAYPSYITLLEHNGIRPSMTENGDPLENAVAERVNGILKQEWLNAYDFDTIEDVRPVLEKIIDYYNANRPHSSVDWLTPEEAHQRNGILKKHWKNKCYNKFVPVKEFANFEPLRRREILSKPFSLERFQMDYKNMGHIM